MMDMNMYGLRLGRAMMLQRDSDEVFEQLGMGPMSRPRLRTIRGSGMLNEDIFAPVRAPARGFPRGLIMANHGYHPGVPTRRGSVVEPLPDETDTSDSQSEDVTVDDIDSEEDFLINVGGEEIRISGLSQLAVGGRGMMSGKATKTNKEKETPGTASTDGKAKGIDGTQAPKKEVVVQVPPTFRWVEIEIV